jgi:3-oxoadipyl-CoA thiolase
MRDVFICDAVRTPIGRYGGALARVRTDDLAAAPIKALIGRNAKADWTRPKKCSSAAPIRPARQPQRRAHGTLLAGLPETVPAHHQPAVRPGLNAVGDAARAIRTEMDFAIAGGVESMTRAPFVTGKASEPFRARSRPTTHARLALRQSGDEGALRHRSDGRDRRERRRGISGGAQGPDAFALRSQQRAARVAAAGYFAEVVAVEAPSGKAGPIVVDKDEHPRPDTTSTISSSPIPQPGTVIAGNASGINDGGGDDPRVRGSGTRARAHTPRLGGRHGVRRRAAAHHGHRAGAVDAQADGAAGLKIGDFDLIEINEAFASQGLACLRQLGVADDAEHVNPHGGDRTRPSAGMSGARLAMTAVHGLERRGGKRAPPRCASASARRVTGAERI